MNVTYGAAEGALERSHLGYLRKEWLDRQLHSVHPLDVSPA